MARDVGGFRWAAVVGVALALLPMGCEDVPDGSPGSRPSSLFVAPATARLGPGDTLRPSALAVHREASTRPVTGEIDWRSEDTTVVRVDRSDGEVMVTAVAPGETAVVASTEHLSSRLTVRVREGGSKTPGPLGVSERNPRYFEAPGGEVVYLTGSHTWGDFQDFDSGDGFRDFDYGRFLDFLARHDHNFLRLWTWEQAAYTPWMKGDFRYRPTAYRRTGPGEALDGRPRFDLSEFDEDYFRRLRRRVERAGRRGIYVSVMLFNGWSVEDKDKGKGNPWRGHPFHAENNVNGVDGDLDGDGEGREVHTLADTTITRLQDRYVRKVVETLGDLDNVLYEVSNESDPASRAWQRYIVSVVREVERDLPRRHPVGITVDHPGGGNGWLFESNADWVSPTRGEGYLADPPPAEGRKVIISDTDHYGTSATTPAWVWKTFLRGMNTAFMDAYDGSATGTNFKPDFDPDDPRWVGVRLAMGHTRRFAERLPMARMVPRPETCSSGFCLAGPERVGPHLLAFFPDAGEAWVDLTGGDGTYRATWRHPVTGEEKDGTGATAGDTMRIEPPFEEGSVLHLRGGEPGRAGRTDQVRRTARGVGGDRGGGR